MKWQQAITDYKHYLKIERGLSQNSIDNYIYDIKKLLTYLEDQSISESALKIEAETIKEFIYSISKSINERSQARIISGLRNFFGYLIFENYRDDNPLDLIESPKIGRKLPDTLTIADIDLLISNIDLGYTYSCIKSL